jgi:hypothetical protein
MTVHSPYESGVLGWGWAQWWVSIGWFVPEDTVGRGEGCEGHRRSGCRDSIWASKEAWPSPAVWRQRSGKLGGLCWAPAVRKLLDSFLVWFRKKLMFLGRQFQVLEGSRPVNPACETEVPTR